MTKRCHITPFFNNCVNFDCHPTGLDYSLFKFRKFIEFYMGCDRYTSGKTCIRISSITRSTMKKMSGIYEFNIAV